MVYLGMDWKSMTMPASLPITTDYFPDKRSLQIDYVLADYSIEPEVVNAELGERYGVHLNSSLFFYALTYLILPSPLAVSNVLPCYLYPIRFYDYVRQPLSTRQLYNEMILQRIAQGFQLILLNKKQLSSSEASPTTSLVRAKGKSRQPVKYIHVLSYLIHVSYFANARK